MSRISVQASSKDEAYDVSSNPEVLLAALQGDDELDEATSLWLAGQSVTKPKSSKD